MKYYKCEYYSISITPCEVERVSRNCVFLKDGKREKKTTTYYCYRPTWQECKDWLVFRRQLQVRSAEGALDYTKANLKKAESLLPTK